MARNGNRWILSYFHPAIPFSNPARCKTASGCTTTPSSDSRKLPRPGWLRMNPGPHDRPAQRGIFHARNFAYENRLWQTGAMQSQLSISDEEFVPRPVAFSSTHAVSKSDEAFQAITGSLRIENGSSYTWSVKAFKRWKKEFRSLYLELHGHGLNEAIPNPDQREILYKTLLGMSGYDVFQNGNTSNRLQIDTNIVQTCAAVAVLVR